MVMMMMIMCLGVVDDVEGENEGASAAETNHHPLCLLWEIQICSIDLTNCLIFLSTMKTRLRKEHEDNSSDHKDDEQCTKHSWARGDRGWGSG